MIYVLNFLPFNKLKLSTFDTFATLGILNSRAGGIFAGLCVSCCVIISGSIRPSLPPKNIQKSSGSRPEKKSITTTNKIILQLLLFPFTFHHYFVLHRLSGVALSNFFGSLSFVTSRSFSKPDKALDNLQIAYRYLN